MLTDPQHTIHPDGTLEWGTLRPGDDLVQVTIISADALRYNTSQNKGAS